MRQLLAALCACLGFAASAEAQSLPALGQWSEIPDSKLFDKLPTKQEAGEWLCPLDPVCAPLTGSARQTKLMELANAYCSAYKACPGQPMIAWVNLIHNPNDRAIYEIRGGGHGARVGNDSYRFDLATLTWTRVEPMQLNTVETGQMHNGQPVCNIPANGWVATHTYDVSIHLDGPYVLWGGKGGGCVGNVTGFGGGQRMFLIDTSAPNAFVWTEQPQLAEWADQAASAVHGDYLYLVDYEGKWAVVDKATLAIVSQGIGMQFNNPMSAMDISEDGTVVMGNNLKVCVGNVATFGTWSCRTFGTNGTPTLPSGQYNVTALYGNRFALWLGNKTVWEFTPGASQALDTWVIHDPLTGPTSEVAARTYGKMFCDETLDVLVGYSDQTENVSLFGLSCAPPPPEQQGAATPDFEQRRAGAIFSNGFDTEPPHTPKAKGTEGVFINASSVDHPTARLPHVENGALRFDILSQSQGSDSGQYFVQFADIMGREIGPGESIFYQWRQFIPSSMLHQLFRTDAGGQVGFKLTLLSDSGTSSCTGNHVVHIYDPWTEAEAVRGGIAAYNRCGPYEGFTRGGPKLNGSRLFDGQPIVDNPLDVEAMMAAGQTYPAPESPGRRCWPYNRGGCSEMVADQWVTYQVENSISAEPYIDGSGRPRHVLRTRVWMQADGQPAELVMDAVKGMANATYGWGRLWLTPYQTGKDETQVHPDTYTLVDEIIISEQRIPDRPYCGC